MPQPKNKAEYSYANDLGGLEFLYARYGDQCFSRHVHSGFCIGVIEEGAQRFFRSGGNHIATQDCIILVNADQVHDGHCATDNGWSYRAIYPTPEMLSALSIEFKDSSGKSPFVPWFPEPVVSDRRTATELRNFYTCLQQSNNHLLRESMYLVSLTALIQRHGRKRPELQALGKAPKAIQQVIDYLDAYFDQNVSLAELATLTGLSPFYLARLFTKSVGLPPHAYQNQRRIEVAKQQILSGISLSEVAVACGFSDQSHLNRHFKKVFGIAPGGYQRMMRIRH